MTAFPYRRPSEVKGEVGTGMKQAVTTRFRARGLALAGMIFLSAGWALAQQLGDAERALIEKAHSLEARGRPDMAAQAWQQVLVADPNNVDAMAGAARDWKLAGNEKQAEANLERLRQVSPNDPRIAGIESLASNRTRDDRLREAGELAREGKPNEAIRIFREYYGDRPPDGPLALSYYQTLYATDNGKAQAIEGMRGLVRRNPADEEMAIALGAMLTYEARTRPEGIGILERHPGSLEADRALRQALLWDAANPYSAAEIREYLKAHPQDQALPEYRTLSEKLQENEKKLAGMGGAMGRPLSPQEQAAYAALSAKRLDAAQADFQALLDKNPSNAVAAAGMGFVRMGQNNFAAALGYLLEAEREGLRDKTVQDAAQTSRFWLAMGEATTAFDGGRLEVAEARFQAALAIRPRSPDALKGLAGLYSQEKKYGQAALAYQELIATKAPGTDGYRGLFLSYARGGQNQQALAMLPRLPAAARAGLARDAEFLGTLAAIYQAQGQDDQARRVLDQALALPFPNQGAGLPVELRLQYAGILVEAKRYAQAQEMYERIAVDAPGSAPAWTGLVSVLHLRDQDSEAIATVERMPPMAYEQALADPGFLSMLGAIYQQANQLEIAQGFLERAAKAQTSGGGQPSPAIELQLAGLYLARNETEAAFQLYRRILTANPNSLDAWKGLIGALQATGRTKEAIAQIALIPPAARLELENDIAFEQTEAGLHAAAGETAPAMAGYRRILAHYAQLKTQPPAEVEVGNAWLLYNARNDRALYSALMRLGARSDLTLVQRQTIETIWASWSVRRAATAIENGNTQRGVEILDAAAQAFPQNVAVLKAVAGGYLMAGHAKQSLAIYKSLDMRDADAADYQGAVDAALAGGDKSLAETWLRQALERYPRDPSILGAAARFEQARGDNARAADYLRASLSAMPPVSAADKLAHTLVNPDTAGLDRRAATPADLARLLDPRNEPFAKTVNLAPLPSYGYDPYDGPVPVALGAPNPAVSGPGVPSATVVPVSAPDHAAASATEEGFPAVVGAAAPPRRVHRKTAVAGAERRNLPTDQGNKTATDLPAAHEPESSPTGEDLPKSPTGANAPVGDAPPASDPASRSRSDSRSDSRPGQPAWSRLSSQTRNPEPPPAQALIEAQTDEQLLVGRAGISPQPTSRAPQENGQLIAAEYKPSATDSSDEAAGEYSAQQPPTQTQSAPTPPTQPQPATPGQSTQTTTQTTRTTTVTTTTTTVPAALPAPRKRRRKPAVKPAPPTQTVPTLATAPSAAPAQQAETPPQPTGGDMGADATPGLTDEQLQDRNLPPLRGPWVRVKREKPALSPRDQAEMQLATIEGGYSGWLGGTGILNYRTGDAGFDAMTALEAQFEASTPLGTKARLTVVARPVFLDSGQATGTAQVQLSSGLTTEPLGTEPGTAIAAAAPAQQNAAGVGGELQLAFPNLAMSAGYSPTGFLVANVIGRFAWRPANGPLTVTFNRDSVKDTQLSYAGLRDPGSASASFPGNVWGGVIANQGSAQFAKGDLLSGFYIGFGGQYITGHHVETNSRYDGSMGAYWRVYANPEYGSLSVGANFFGMSYAHNLQAFTYGMGGYFSPQAYFLANMPLTWTGHYGTKWHYTILGGAGVQAFNEDANALAPLDPAIEVGVFDNVTLPGKTSVGPNYDLRGQAAYALGEHWFAGGFTGFNNSRNYGSAQLGFFVRYLFRPQPSTANGPTGLFPADGLRPFTVP